MRPQVTPIRWSGQPAAAEIADTLMCITAQRSAALVLPALWGADAVAEQLRTRSRLLHVDAGMGGGAEDSPLALALQTEGDLAGTPSENGIATALQRWAHQATERQPHPPLILVEESRYLCPTSAELLEKLAHRDVARLVLLLRTEEEISDRLGLLVTAGKMTVTTPQAHTPTSIKPPLRNRLQGPISTSASRRVASLTGGYPVLADMVLDAAQSEQVLTFTGGTWMWETCEAPLRQILAQRLPGLLSGLDENEQDLVVLTAVAGYLPERWAHEKFGQHTLVSLRRQRILGTDATTRQGFLDLYVIPEALIQAVRTNFQDTEIIRLWHKIGQYIPRSVGGLTTEAALTWWAARAGEVVPTEGAIRASRLCIGTGWYQPVEEIVAAADTVTPMLRVLRARAQLAMGNVEDASAELQQLAEHLEGDAGEESEAVEAQRHGIILGRRLELFHPETAEPVIKQLEGVSSDGRPVYLDRALSLTDNQNTEDCLRELVHIRHFAGWDESLAAQLWIGTHLGLKAHPGLGSLVLSILRDDLVREGGHYDVLDAATAVLLLISSSHDWRTDEETIELRAWGHQTAENPALAAVADVATATLSMQRDRMVTAHAHAAAALATFEHRDPYGLYGFASALCATTASYVSQELGFEAHRAHRMRRAQLPECQGFPATRLLTQALSLIGTGPPSTEIAAELFDLALEARDDGEWNQEQQLLLLAMLGGSQDAVEGTLSAPWVDQPGRTSMIVLLARGLAELDDQSALNAARVLLAAGANFFGIAILAARWPRRAHMRPTVRKEIIRTVLAMRRRATERSELLETFDDLMLDERERAVVTGLTRGRSTEVIAQHLNLSPRTIETTISRMLRRFGCENRVELTSLDLLEPTQV